MKRRYLALIAVLAGCMGAANAQVTFDDWVVVNADDNSGDVIAATSTDSTGKELLAYRCFVKSQECLHVLLVESSCEADAEYPMLLNAATGASMVTGVCSKVKSSDQLLLKPYELLRKQLKSGTGLLGFAVPMQSGSFRVLRFSLKGSTAASAAAERLIQERVRAKPSLGRGSVTL